MDFFVRMQAIVLSFSAGHGGAAVQVTAATPPPPVYAQTPGYVEQVAAPYEADYGYDSYDGYNGYADVAPPDTFFDELDGAGSWYEDDTYGAMFIPSRSESAPCYQDTARYGNWIQQPTYGRVWVPEQRFRRQVVARVRPQIRRVVVNPRIAGNRRVVIHPYAAVEQRERARLLRSLNELSAREWRRLERSGASQWERQRLHARQQRRLATELRRLEMKQARRRRG